MELDDKDGPRRFFDSLAGKVGGGTSESNSASENSSASSRGSANGGCKP